MESSLKTKSVKKQRSFGFSNVSREKVILMGSSVLLSSIVVGGLCILILPDQIESALTKSTALHMPSLEGKLSALEKKNAMDTTVTTALQARIEAAMKLIQAESAKLTALEKKSTADIGTLQAHMGTAGAQPSQPQTAQTLAELEKKRTTDMAALQARIEAATKLIQVESAKLTALEKKSTTDAAATAALQTRIEATSTRFTAVKQIMTLNQALLRLNELNSPSNWGKIKGLIQDQPLLKKQIDKIDLLLQKDIPSKTQILTQLKNSLSPEIGGIQSMPLKSSETETSFQWMKDQFMRMITIKPILPHTNAHISSLLRRLDFLTVMDTASLCQELAPFSLDPSVMPSYHAFQRLLEFDTSSQELRQQIHQIINTLLTAELSK